MNRFILQESTPSQEGIYQGSKWLKFQILCDEKELSSFFDRLDFPYALFHLTGVGQKEPIEVTSFLQKWKEWIDGLKEGKIPSSEELQSIFAMAIIDDPHSLWLQKVEGKGYLVKQRLPVLLVQSHFFSYSCEDEAIHPMILGKESIFWGLQFSWPQIYQDPETMEFLETKKTALFDSVKSFIKESSRPTPFLMAKEEGLEKKIYSSIRLGKNCFSWIHLHPQLQKLKVLA